MDNFCCLRSDSESQKIRQEHLPTNILYHRNQRENLSRIFNGPRIRENSVLSWRHEGFRSSVSNSYISKRVMGNDAVFFLMSDILLATWTTPEDGLRKERVTSKGRMTHESIDNRPHKRIYGVQKRNSAAFTLSTWFISIWTFGSDWASGVFGWCFDSNNFRIVRPIRWLLLPLSVASVMLP